MGRFYTGERHRGQRVATQRTAMGDVHGIDPHGGAPVSDVVYLVGLIVIVMAILSFVGLR